jgi:hypothetical protein
MTDKFEDFNIECELRQQKNVIGILMSLSFELLRYYCIFNLRRCRDAYLPNNYPIIKIVLCDTKLPTISCLIDEDKDSIDVKISAEY